MHVQSAVRENWIGSTTPGSQNCIGNQTTSKRYGNRYYQKIYGILA